MAYSEEEKKEVECLYQSEPMDYVITVVDHLSRQDLPVESHWSSALSLEDLYRQDPTHTACFPAGLDENLMQFFVKSCFKTLKQELYRYLAFCLLPLVVTDVLDPGGVMLRKYRHEAYTSVRKRSATAKWSTDRIRQAGLDEAVKCRVKFCKILKRDGWPDSVITFLRDLLDDLSPDPKSTSPRYRGISKVKAYLTILQNEAYYGETQSRFKERKAWETALEFNDLSMERLNELVLGKGLRRVYQEHLNDDAFDTMFSPFVKTEYTTDGLLLFQV